MLPGKIGQYEIRAEIGQGGMATVYRAYQAAVDRDVAIKLIRQDDGDINMVQRFQREARIIGQLEHPHILPVYDFAANHTPPYIVMRFVDGGTLKELMAKHVLSFEQIAQLLRQIAAALDYAHSRNIIHRDIKPSNILLDRLGNALVSDFGIARIFKSAGQHADLTRPGAVIGTPGYMAPEQGMGTEPLTPRADIYSLGVVFFEMITGQEPYYADNSLALMLKHVRDPIPIATTLKPDLPPAVDALIARVMAKDPTDRFTTASAFADAVAQVLLDGRTSFRSPLTANHVSSKYQDNETILLTRGEGSQKVAASPPLEHNGQSPLFLSLSLLGAVHIAHNDAPITGFDYDKVRALLVFLAVESDRPHRRETLAELLWPDQPEQVGRDNLRQALATLRKAIGDHRANPPFLLITRETIQFNIDSEFWLDTGEFAALLNASARHRHSSPEACPDCIQRLEKVAELYRGTFAQDLELPNNDEFQQWLAFHRETYQDQMLTALFTIAEYHQRQAQYELARRCAWRQIELQPWREEAYRQLMNLLALSGQRTAALAQYERCCRILDEELGVLPSPETVALYEQIRAGEIQPLPQYVDSVVPGRRPNLPSVPTSFVGRQKELDQLLQYLADPDCRLVTISGLGGIGKTRLAIEAAHRAAALFQNIYFVSLAALENPDLIPSTIASAIQFSTTSQDNFAAQLVSYLSDKKLLLTVDNLEHFTDGLDLFAEIVTYAPGVKLLLTSRKKLDLPGEWVLPLKGLPTSASITQHGAEESAVDLFVQRARMVQPDFAYTASEQPHILRICQLVDGMPLGIELASAWMQMLSCHEIAESIASNLSFLTSTTSDRPERHQSLRAVFEHSWVLLSPEQQRVLSALAVFRGGFQADAALEVTGAALSTLLALVSKSMMTRDPGGRYHIHELLRQYALEKLTASGDTEQIYVSHLRFFVNLADAAEMQIRGGQQIPWLERLEADNDNLRAALEFSLKHEFPELGLRLAASLWFFWHVRNYFREGLDWLKALLAATPEVPTLARAQALFAAGWLAQSRRELEQAAVFTQASYQLAQQIGDSRSIAYPLSTLAWLAYFQGDYQQAEALGETSLSLFRQVSDSWGIVHTLNILGYIAESRADYARAESFQREGINVARAAGDNDSLGWSLYLLGRVLAERSQHDQAVQLCNQALEIYRETGNRWSIAVILYTLGNSAMALGDLPQAAALLEESINLLREMSDFWAMGGPLGCLGMASYLQGDMNRATDLSQESLTYFRQFGDKRGMAYALNTLGRIAFQQERYTAASSLFKESLVLRQGSGIWHGIEVCFDFLAAISLVLGEEDRAVTLFGAAEHVRELLDVGISGTSRTDYASSVAIARQRLSDPVFKSLWAAGKSLPLEDIILYALNAAE